MRECGMGRGVPDYASLHPGYGPRRVTAQKH
jgi:hypothetical protein